MMAQMISMLLQDIITPIFKITRNDTPSSLTLAMIQESVLGLICYLQVLKCKAVIENRITTLFDVQYMDTLLLYKPVFHL